MDERRILRVDDGRVSVARAARFQTEDELHRAVADHPEVLPSEDLRLGPLTAIASKLTLESWELDLLAVDPRGRLVIIEFKTGTENHDVRKVIAQMLDYGSLLWGRTYEDVATLCKNSIGFGGTLGDHVSERLAAIGYAGFDPVAFEDAVETGLASGDFVFMYVARDLDERTRRIMSYLSEGPHMSFFAVEVDCFRDDTSSTVLVPRTVFVPPWVTARRNGTMSTTQAGRTLAEQPPEIQQLVQRMDQLAAEHGLRIVNTTTGRAYRISPNLSAIGVYWASGRGIEFNLQRFREHSADDRADGLLERISHFVGHTITATKWPAIPIAEAAARIDDTLTECIAPYIEAAIALNAREV